MTDGCWEDFVFPDDMDEEEQEQLLERFGESGVYEVLEDEEGWSLNDTEAWVWGPILIEDERGNRVKIICADENGNAVDFKEDSDEGNATVTVNLEEQPVLGSGADWPFPNN